MPEPWIVSKPAFTIVGRKTWIGGEGNEEFGLFWQECRRNGVIAELAALRGERPGPVTNAMFLGLSAVERDPSIRSFWFYVAVESTGPVVGPRMEAVTVPASTWAVFRAFGTIPDALVAAEMRAFGQWLPVSGFVHDLAPEMEVYPPSGQGLETACEFWLPIKPA